ncbi:hypothetical protein RCL1_006045 [Eukaryota sp. TZLM3-RCL]
MYCCLCSQLFNRTNKVPLIICHNNHVVCHSCKGKHASCPFCKAPISDSTVASNLLATIEGSNNPTLPSSCLDRENSPLPNVRSGPRGFVFANSMRGRRVVTKVVHVTRHDKMRLRNTVGFLAKHHHPLLIQLFGLVESGENVGIIMEMADGHLQVPSPLSEKTLRTAIDIVDAVTFLHSKTLIHGNLKPSNLLLLNGKIKISDCVSTAPMQNTTSKYSSLESFQGKLVPLSDVYSIGVILYELLCNKVTFSGVADSDLESRKAMNHLFRFDSNDHTDLKKLVTNCCCNTAILRPTLKDIRSVLCSLLSSTDGIGVAAQYLDHNIEIPGLQNASSLLAQRRSLIVSMSVGNNNEYKSLEAINKKILNDPNNAQLYYEKGCLLSKMEEYEDAVDCFDIALSLSPRFLDAYYQKGICFEWMSRYEDALDAYESAVAIDPTCYYTHGGRARALFCLSRYNDAILACNQAIKYNSKDLLTYLYKGRAYEALGRNKCALETYDTALELEPNNSLGLEYKGFLLEQMKRFTDALAVFERMLKATTVDVKIHSAVERIHKALHRDQEIVSARRHLSEIVSTSSVRSETRQENNQRTFGYSSVLNNSNIPSHCLQHLRFLPEGFDRSRLESYLDDAKFIQIFSMDKTTFYDLPKWKQMQKKKEMGWF